MNQSMDMTAGSVGDIVPPSKNRWWAIAAGIGVAAVLGYGAALIATDHLPGTDHLAAAPIAAVATPQVESGSVSPGTVGPFEAQSASPQAQAAVGVTGLSPQEITQLRGEAMVEYFASQAAVGASGIAAQSNAASDDLATRPAAPAQSNAASDDLATRSAAGTSGVVAHSALDPFEDRSGASPQETSGSLSQPAAGYFDGQWHIAEAPKYPTPEFR